MSKSQEFSIPLHKTYWGKEEEKAAIDAIRTSTGVGDLNYSEKLAKALGKYLGVKYVLPTASGTAALELAFACTLKRNQEVIMPSYTFSSCANAAMLLGAKPVFVDVDINTYNIDPVEIEKHITKRTKAILVVHYAGMACNMDEIKRIADKHKLLVIEDAAHALGSKYKGKFLGTIGDIGCFSFHGTKNAASGEGGAFVTNDRDIFKIAEIIREKGTNRSSFMRGERKKYSWVRVGRSLILSDILSAIALEQVKKLNEITSKRTKNASYLLKQLSKLSSKIVLPQISEYCDPNWHIFAIRVPRQSRNNIVRKLREFGIEASFHYLPLHSSAMGKNMGYKKSDVPVTEEVASTLIRLPIYPGLKKSEIEFVAATMARVL